MIIKIGSIRKETWTCELREKGQSQQRDQHELTEPERVFRRKQVARLPGRRGVGWEGQVMVWNQPMVRAKPEDEKLPCHSTSSSHCLLAPLFPIGPTSSLPKGKKAHTRLGAFTLDANCVLFYLEKSSWLYLIVMDNFRIKGTNCSSPPTQWVD